MNKHIALSPCPFCGAGLTLDIDEDGGVAILHSLKGEKNCWFPSIVEVEMPVGTTLEEMTEIINRRPTQESYEHALVGASLVAAARLQDKVFEIQDLKTELARRDEELGLTEKKLCNIDRLAMEEIARRDELIKHKEEVIGHIEEKKKTVFELLSNTIKRRNKKIAEQADTIRRLKEDAERLASTYVIEVFPHEWVCRGGCHHWARFGEQIEHSPDCPITLHRALMKELE